VVAPEDERRYPQGGKPWHQIVRGLLPGVRHEAILDSPCLENTGRALAIKAARIARISAS
jgi:hypothetical protein